MKIAGLALHHLLLWNPTDFPVVPLCPLPSRIIKTIGRAVFLMTVDLRVFLPTMQTGHDLSRFSGVRFPAFSSAESMTQSLGFEQLPAGLAGFRRSILQIQTESCPL
jgi:hypothetical protein